MKRLLSMLLVVTLVSVCSCIITSAASKNAYQMIPATAYDAYGNAGLFTTAGGRIGGTNAGTWVCFKGLDFQGADVFGMEVYLGVDAANCNNQMMTVKLDSLNGPLVAAFAVQPSSWDTELKHTVDVTQHIEGTHDVYFVWGGPCNLFQFKFNAFFRDTSGYLEYTADSRYADIAEDAYPNEIELVSQLGLVDEYAQNSYNPQLPVTRGEFAQAVYRMVAEGVASEPEQVFRDVPTDNPDFTAISVLHKLQIVTGAEWNEYRPQEFITVTDAAVLLCRMLGYTAIAEGRGGYPSGYLAVASEEKITSGIGGGAQDVVRRDTLARLLYNAIHARYLDIRSLTEEDATYRRSQGILCSTKNLTFGKGVVTQTSQTSLYAPVSELAYDKVLIEDKLLSVGSTNAVALLGIDCEYYYDSDDTLVAIIPQRSTEQLLLRTGETCDFSSISMKELRYFSEGKREMKISLPARTNFIYNGKAVDFDLNDVVRAEDFTGTIRLIDNGGGYSTVFIDQYENIVIDSIDDSVEHKLSDKLKGVVVDLSDPNCTVVCTRNGQRCNLADLPLGEAALLYRSANVTGNKLIRIVVENITCSGTVTALETGEKIIIDGKQYRKARENSAVYFVGQKGTFLLNSFGEIVDCTALESQSAQIGCYIKYKADPASITPRVDVRLLTTDNKLTDYIFAENPVIDGIRRKSAEEITTWLAGADTKTPVRYLLDAQGNIRMLDTYLVGADNADDCIKRLSNGVEQFIYRSESGMLVSNGIASIPLANDATCFTFWKDKDETAASVVPFSSLGINRETAPAGAAFTTDKSSVVADFFVWNDRTARTWSDAMIVDKVTSRLNTDGVAEPVICGYMGKTYTSYAIDRDCLESNIQLQAFVKSLCTGDIVKYLFALDKVSYIDLKYLYDGSASRDVTVNGSVVKLVPQLSNTKYSVGDSYQDDHMSFGTVLKKNEGYLEIALGADEGSKEIVGCAGAGVLKVYNGRNGRSIEVVPADSIAVGDAAVTWISIGKVKTIVLYE